MASLIILFVRIGDKRIAMQLRHIHVQTALQLKPISAKLGQEYEMNLKKRSGRLCERISPLLELSPIIEIREQQRL
ncbi:hypothetical protein [Paenibacillus antibioticophila]|uniref:hypothetical protein n=1 Tax=Paenibacillus antibioticophila TaxID=1274374 RepID=UPI0005C968CF|nr:hypothetical protein [Paenibacillus antibioticophila]